MSSNSPMIRFGRHASLTLALTLIAGVSALHAPVANAAATTTTGSTELSPTPVNETQAEPPNIAVTFDNSGSMAWTHLGDVPPYTTNNDGSTKSGLSNVNWSNGPWRCAGMVDADYLDGSTSPLDSLVMNGVYYNPNVTYTPPVYADGTSFPQAGDSSQTATTLAYLDSVWIDGIAINRPLSAATAGSPGYYNNPDVDSPGAGYVTNLSGTGSSVTTYYVEFGTSASVCPSSADAGSCKQYTSGGSSSSYFFYYKGNSGSSGSGVSKQYYGTSLSVQTTSGSGYTKASSSNSAAANYSMWSVTTISSTADNRWRCGQGGSFSTSNSGDDGWSQTSPMDGLAHTLSDGSSVTYTNGGPYYYRLKKGVTVSLNSYGQPSTTTDIQTLYTGSNWEAVPVPPSQYQNFANWYAYYRTRNQMARSSLARVFGSNSLASTTSTGGYGSTIRVAWQNLYTSDKFTLQSSTIISSLIDTTPATCKSSQPSLGSQSLKSGTTTSPPTCYRSDFFNWIFQVPASGGTPTRSAMDRAGLFFERGGSLNTNVSKGDLHDPYWQASTTGTGTGSELSCRQNFHMLITDGLWNGSADGPSAASLNNAPSTTTSLPDGTAFPTPGAGKVTAIYNQVDDGGDTGYASLSDIAFNYWATNLRPDLYDPANGKFVAPYINDTTTGVVTTTTQSSSGTNDANVNDEIYFNPKNDPANWPHMSQYLIGLGVSGVLNYSANTDCTDTTDAIAADACALRKGTTNSSGSTVWPTPNGSGSGIAANIDDTWHAALAGRGQFFSAANPQDLVTKLSSVLTSITARAATPAISAVNASVLTTGALSFQTGYSSVDWTGLLEAFGLNADGTTGPMVWNAGTLLTGGTPSATSRQILTSSLGSAASVAAGMSFEPTSTFDTAETTGLGPATPTSTDTQTNRINYLRGDRTNESNGTYRTRDSLLGAIIDSQPAYVSYPASGYTNNWPSGSPEATAAAASNGTDDKSYDSFVSDHASRDPTVYVGANDGMLHAFYAPVPTCNNTDPTTGYCTSYTAGNNAGQELFAYIPRAVYGNLGSLTSATSFTFQPTVNGSPVTSDVFFSENNQATWHTLLVGSLRLGGRGVYALDITDPTAVTEANASSKVLWEFDSDVTAPSSSTCTAIQGTSSDSAGCKPSDLGFTYGQPNIGRLANGKWVVLVPSGYFPDCSQTDKPVICNNASPPATPTDSTGKTFSSLFVLDAQTGALIAELKTPTSIANVASYGLSSPVLGDYNNDQVDDVAFAGDLAGNVWRFDLSDPSPSNWKVTLTYQPTTQGAQPITTMPRLFPDSTTNRFMVVFGTGKYLGASDNTSTTIQAVYGIRDTLDSSGNPLTVNGTSSLVEQTLGSVAGTGSLAGATLLTLTSNTVNSSSEGWYFNLATYTGTTQTDAGERVVVTPAALFNSNTVVISTLIPGTSDPCNPTTTGSILFVNASTGSPGTAGVSSLGGYPYVGAQVNNVRTSGTLPVTTPVGGGSTVLPGVTISGTNPAKPLTGNAAIWRRRSWSILTNDQ